MAKSARKLNISKQAFTNADYKAAHSENNALSVADTDTTLVEHTTLAEQGIELNIDTESEPMPVQTSALDNVIQEITETPAPKPPRVYSNRTETRVQLYPFANLSVPDGAYLRFWSSFADNSNPSHVVTFDNIRQRCVHIAGRNPHPNAGGKNGCTDHARSKRLYEAGFIHPVSDNNVRVGFTFTDKARASRDYHLGLADEYCPQTGALLVLAS